VLRAIEDYVRSLGLDAYLVGGAVRDELLGLESKDADFLVPGVDHAGLRAALAPHGRVADLEVAGQLVGARLFPSDRAIRKLAPSGIEFAPPRAERSTGPGRHDFEIVAGADISVEDDMRRRDFTVNAIAKRLATGELVDPLGGAADLERRILRTVSPQSFAEDPLRLVRGLRFVSQLELEPAAETLAQMRAERGRVRLVSAERIGGGLHADGLGELSRLLLGVRPQKALLLARDTGVLVELLPELEPAIGFVQSSKRQHLPLDEHIFAVVQAAADQGASLAVRLAALLHDLGKPHDPGQHAKRGAELAAQILRRLRYPTALRRHVVAIVTWHSFQLESAEPVDARRFLHRHGDALALDLIAHRLADLAGKRPDPEELERTARFRDELAAARDEPHRLDQLALDGSDLIALGATPGPDLGRVLDALLAEVVEAPEANDRDHLVTRAKALLGADS
jgi:putative nucleotidyltransferase with HDIG domain